MMNALGTLGGFGCWPFQKSVAVREWHGWVGNVITLAMAFRVFIPQAGRALGRQESAV